MKKDLDLLAEIDAWQSNCAQQQQQQQVITKSNAGSIDQWLQHQAALKIHRHFKQCKTSERVLDLPTTSLPPLM